MNIKKIFLLTFLVGIPLTLNSYQVNAKETKPIYKNVDPNKEQTLPLGLKNHNGKKLARFINQTVTPGNKNYRKYITPQQFGAQYGLSSQRVNAVERNLHKYHLRTYTYPGNIVMSVTGKTKDIEQAFHLQIKQTINQKNNYQEAFGQGRVDKQIQNDVSYLDKTALEIALKNPKRLQATSKVIAAEKSYEQRFLKKVSDPNVTNRSYQKFTQTYNADSLYRNGNRGQGQTIGILSTADFQMSDIEKYWKEFGVHNQASRIKKVFVDHVDSDTNRDETTMDVEQVSALAPSANINVYIGNDSYDGGFVTLYAQAIGKDNVDVLANSFGNVESNYSKHSPMIVEFKLLNLLSQQAAAQGITNFNAAGDTGPYSFYNNNKLSAGVPADSPYVTAVGGTTLPFKNVPYSVFSGTNLKYQFKNDKII